MPGANAGESTRSQPAWLTWTGAPSAESAGLARASPPFARRPDLVFQAPPRAPRYEYPISTRPMIASRSSSLSVASACSYRSIASCPIASSSGESRPSTSSPSRQVPCAPTALLAQLVADAIENGLTQIRLQRARPTNVEVSKSPERLQQGVLHEVVGVGRVPRPLRQFAPGPTSKRRDVPGQEPVHRLLVTRARALD